MSHKKSKKIHKRKKDYEEEEDEDDEEEEDEESENQYKEDDFVVSDNKAYEEEEEESRSFDPKLEDESDESLGSSDREIANIRKKKLKKTKKKEEVETIKRTPIEQDDEEIGNFIEQDDYIENSQVMDEEIEHRGKVRNISSSIPHQIFNIPESANIKVEQKTTKISKIYTTQELEEEFATSYDNKIKLLDYPERILLRYKEDELPHLANAIDQEADWIFEKLKIQLSSIELIQNVRKKIAMVLEFYKKEFYDIPYIVTYKKCIFEPELTSNDIWKLFELDNEWQALNDYKQNVYQQFKTIRSFLGEKKAEFMEKRNIDAAKSIEELKDMEVFIHFTQEMNMDDQQSKEANEDNIKDTDGDEQMNELYRPIRKSIISEAKKNRIDEYAKTFSISSHDLAINLELILKNENPNLLIPAPQPVESPPDLAGQYKNETLDQELTIMTKACDFLALEMGSHPFIRQYVWNYLKNNCYLSTKPTQQGKAELNVFNPSFRTKRISKKPINLFNNDLYLDIAHNMEKGLIVSTINILENEEDFKEITSRISSAYMPNSKGDEETENDKGWKIMREEAIRILIKKVLLNQFIVEIRNELIAKAENYVINECGNAFFNLLLTGPYRKHRNENNDNDEIFKDNELPRVMSFVYDQNKNVYCVILNKNGEVLDHYIFSYLANKPLRLQKPEEKQNYYDDQAKCKALIQQHKPDLIVIGANDLKCRYLKDQIIACEPDMMKPDEGNASIWVTFGDLAIPRIYANSHVSEKANPSSNVYLRQAVSLGRFKQNPLDEVLQLWHEDINKNFCLKLSLHPLQRMVNQAKLAKMLEMKAIQVVNSIGVEINKAFEIVHLKSSLSFVSGLGPRKAQYILEKLVQYNGLAMRTELLIRKILDKRVMVNCNGFIKIKTAITSDVMKYNLLDMTRIPIDFYPLTNQLIKTALEDENLKDSVDLVEIILRDPKKLEILDLNEYIKKQSENTTAANSIYLLRFMIQLIKAEINAPFTDPRKDHKDLTPSEIFLLLIGDENFKVGHMTIARVIKVDEQHVKCRLTNDLEATVWIKDIFEDTEKSSNTEMKARYKEGALFEARIKAINENNFKIDLATKPSIMVNHKQFMNVNELDHFELLEEDWINQRYQQENKEEHHKYQPRRINHDKFKNVTCQGALDLLRNKEIGDCLFRPSSRGMNNLTLTWKFFKHVYCHIDVVEEDKIPGSIISSKLRIANEVYSSLNEIIDRYVNPCAQLVREAVQSRKFIQFDSLGDFEKKLRNDKATDGSIVHYNLTILREYPLYIIMGYTPKANSVINEFIKIKPNGYSFHQEYFGDLDDLITFFKRNYGKDTYSDYVRKIKAPALEYHRPIEKEYRSTGDYDNDTSGGNDNYGVVQSGMSCKYCHESGHMVLNCPKKQERSGGSSTSFLKGKRSRSPNRKDTDWANDDNVSQVACGWGETENNNDQLNCGWGETTQVQFDEWGASANDDNNNQTSSSPREKDRKKGCFNCGEDGHMSRECPNPRKDRNSGGGDRKRTCFNCGEEGHLSKECPNPRKDHGGDRDRSDRDRDRGDRDRDRDRDRGDRDRDRDRDRKKTCFNCNEEGHMSFECTKPKKERGGMTMGGERKKTCFNCWEEGHMSKDCPNPRKERNDRGRGSYSNNNRSRAGRGYGGNSPRDEGKKGNDDDAWGANNDSNAWDNQPQESNENKGWGDQDDNGNNEDGW